MSSLPHVVSFLLMICLSAERAKALALPLALKHTTSDTFNTSQSNSLTEFAFLSIFVTAIIWLYVGAYVLSVITQAEASDVLRGLRRNATVCPLRRLHAFSPPTAFGGAGRAGLVSRRIPARRGGLAYPMWASRARRHQRPSHGALLPV